MVTRKIKWSFNPPASPHFGGVFESMIKSVKRALVGTLAKASLTDEELATAFVYAEDFVNSRPLTVLSIDIEDPRPLTPNHFLIGRATFDSIAEQEADEQERVHPRDRWRTVLSTIKQTWKRWMKEVLPALNIRQKWCQEHQDDVKEGDIVMVIDTSTRRGEWPLERILKTFPGADGRVRVVDVLVRKKTYRRSVHQLIPLEITPQQSAEAEDVADNVEVTTRLVEAN